MTAPPDSMAHECVPAPEDDHVSDPEASDGFNLDQVALVDGREHAPACDLERDQRSPGKQVMNGSQVEYRQRSPDPDDVDDRNHRERPAEPWPSTWGDSDHLTNGLWPIGGSDAAAHISGGRFDQVRENSDRQFQSLRQQRERPAKSCHKRMGVPSVAVSIDEKCR